MHIIAADADASQILLISTDNPRIDLDSRTDRSTGKRDRTGGFQLCCFQFSVLQLGHGQINGGDDYTVASIFVALSIFISHLMHGSVTHTPPSSLLTGIRSEHGVCEI